MNARAQTAATADEAVVVRRPDWGQWIAGGLVLVFVAAIVHSLWSNPRLERDVIARYLFSEPILRGVMLTLELTAVIFAAGMALGLVIAAMASSRNPVLRGFAWGFNWFFRAVPPLVQLIFWAFLGALYPTLELGIPFTSIVLFSAPTNDIIKPYVAAVVGFMLIEAAYQSEAIRAGLLSVPSTQTEAAQALGYSRMQTFFRIVLPQAMPAMLPPSANNLIILLKGTSLVSVIGATELLTSTQRIYSQTYQVIPMLMVASLWYLAITSVLVLGQRWLERRYTRGRLAAGGESF